MSVVTASPSYGTRWRSVALSDISQIINGGTPKSNVAAFWGGEHQWLTPADMGKLKSREIGKTPRTITNDGLAKSSARLAPPNSVILSTRAPIGHLAINTTPMAFNQGCRGIVPSAQLHNLFLYYFLMANKEQLEELGTGTTFKELSASNLKGVEIPLPPLEEQERIVAVLDKAFAALDRARALAESNLADAEELFAESMDRMLLANTQNWQKGRFVDLVGSVSTGPFGSVLHKSDYVEDQIPIVNPANIVDAKIFRNRAKTVTREAAERLKSYRLTKNDIVLGRRGEMGRCAVVSEEQNGWLCGTGSFFIRPKTDVSSHFVSYLLRSKNYVEQLTDLAGGATMLNLSNSAMAKMPFALPSLSEQLKLLSNIEALSLLSMELQSIYKAKLTEIAALRQSLLQKAFAGELV